MVEADPEVLRVISVLSVTLQDYFKQVVSILTENPYRFRQLIQQARDQNGRVYYQYYDGIIPLAFQYRVYPPEADWIVGQGGYVRIIRAIPDW